MFEKSLGMSHFQVLLYPEKPELAPPGPSESFAMGKMNEPAQREAGGRIIDNGPAWQNGNPGEYAMLCLDPHH